MTFVKDRLKPRKITLFLYLHRATSTRFNFHYLKMFHYMFGDVFWSHLMLEVTWWPHDTRSSRRRERKRKFLPNRSAAEENLNALIRNLTSLPASMSVPVVFIDSIYDPLDYIDDSKAERDKIGQIQRSQERALEDKLFDPNVIGFECLTCNYDFIPRGSGGSLAPVDTENELSQLHFQGTSLTLSCLVPEPLFGNDDCEDDCNSGWELNGVPVGDDLKHLTNPSGFMTTNELVISYLKRDEHKGTYQCYANHCIHEQCKKVLSQKIVTVDVVETPPQIKVDDRKTKTFHCRQQVPASYTQKVRFFIHRLNGEETQLLSHRDFESVSQQETDKDGEDGKKFVDQSFSNRFSTKESDGEEQMKGLYHCTSQFGEPSLSPSPLQITEWVDSVSITQVDIDGGWSDWSSFGSCDATSLYGRPGKRLRKR